MVENLDRVPAIAQDTLTRVLEERFGKDVEASVESVTGGLRNEDGLLIMSSRCHVGVRVKPRISKLHMQIVTTEKAT